jgi:hypothetical protein
MLTPQKSLPRLLGLFFQYLCLVQLYLNGGDLVGHVDALDLDDRIEMEPFALILFVVYEIVYLRKVDLRLTVDLDV